MKFNLRATHIVIWTEVALITTPPNPDAAKRLGEIATNTIALLAS
ncbi:MAG: hypothetical protein ACKO1K_04945 [Burkholderiales bacterium]